MLRLIRKTVLFLIILILNVYSFQPVFDSRIIYPSENPKNISITADFNNDGYVDYIASTTSSSGAAENYSYLFLNNGDGTFRYASAFQSSGSGVTLLLNGDFNNDGFNDIGEIVRTYLYNILSIYMNQGDGSFEFTNRYEIGQKTYNAPYIIVSDVNNDGFDDILQMKTGELEILFSNGDGSFSFGNDGDGIVNTPIDHYGKIRSWDVNNDAYPDILVQGSKTVTPVSGEAYLQPFIAAYINQKDTTFSLASEFLYGSSGDDQIYSCQTGFFNSDSEKDLVIKDIQGKFTILINQGDGVFSAQGTCPSVSEESYLNHFSIGDINGDGFSDITVSDRENGNVLVYLNNGDTEITFSDPTDFPGIYYAGSYAKEEYACHDLNNDSYSDLAFYIPSLSVSLNHGDGTFQTYNRLFNMGTKPPDMAAGDFNNDGAVDIVTVDNGNIYISYNDGAGGFLSSQMILSGLQYVNEVFKGYFNDDDILDIALTGSLKLFYGREDGSFDAGINFANIFSDLKSMGGKAADFNGDGEMDYALYYFGDLQIILSTENGTFQLGKYSFPAEAVQISQIHDISIIDIDRDDDLDIVLGYKNNLYINFNDGSGDFSLRDSLECPGLYGLVFEDFNGDGNTDMAASRMGSYDGNVSVYLNNGNNGFSEPEEYGNYYISNYTKIKSGDMDSDGDMDLIVQGKQGINLFINAGNGTFLQNQVYAVGDAGVTFDLADFNQDSTMDLAVLSNIPGKQCVYVFPNIKRSPNSIFEDQTALIQPKKFRLEQNYPNPFNPTTTIKYQLPAAGNVELSIYNVLGQKMQTLVSKRKEAGSYKVDWNGKGFASGIYFYRLEIDQKLISTMKLVLLK